MYIKVECNTKVLASERQHKSEVIGLKKALTDADDKAVALKDDLFRANTEIERLTALNQQLDRAREEGLTVQTQLRADLRHMQQSVAASYRLESAQNIGIGVDADTAMRLNDAKNDAKTRQLSNKVR